MAILDYVVLLGIGLLAVGAIVWMRRRKKKGKGCCGSCSGCASSSRCSQQQPGDSSNQL